MSVNLGNPFANSTATPLVVSGLTPKLSGIPTLETTKTPSAPTSANVTCYYNTIVSAANSLNYVLGQVFSNNILSLNSTQYLSMQNSSILLQYIANNYLPTNNTGNTITFTQSELQDLAISYDAVTSLQGTGLLLTSADLANSVVSVDVVDQYAPNGALTIICHDDHFICALPNSGLWLASNVGNAASWNPLSAGDMETYNDQPLAHAQYSGLVVVFGEQSFEYWQDLSSTPFPYGRVSGASQPYGLAAINSIVEGFMGTVVFLGRQRTGQLHIYALNGMGPPTIISTPDLDEIINAMEYPGGAFAYAYDMNGYSFYRITFPEDGRSFDYCGGSSTLGAPPTWNEVQSGVDATGRHLTTLGTTFNNSTIASDYASGNVYIIDPDNYTDNGYLIKREFVTRNLTFDGNEGTINALYLDMEVGDSQQSGSSAPFTGEAHIECYVSLDGGRTWGKPFVESLGKVGQYRNRVIFRQLGTARSFKFRFVVTDPVPFVLVSIYADASVGSG